MVFYMEMYYINISLSKVVVEPMWLNNCLERWSARWMVGGWMDRWIDGWIEGWIDG